MRIYQNTLPVKFDTLTNIDKQRLLTLKYFCLEAEPTEVKDVLDRPFYMPLYLKEPEEIAGKIIQAFQNDMFLNNMPKTSEILPRFLTKVSFKYETINKLRELILKQLIAMNIPDSADYKLFIKGFCDVLGDFKDKIDALEGGNFNEAVFFLDMYDSTVTSNRTAIFGSKGFPLFTTYNITDFNKVENYQLNFSTKVTGVTSAAFSCVPFVLPLQSDKGEIDVYFKELDGASMKIHNNGLCSTYIGTLYDGDSIDRADLLRVNLEIGFVPANDDRKLFKNQEQFDKLNSFIDYISEGIYKYGAESEYGAKQTFDFKLSYLSVTVAGENKLGVTVKEVADSLNNMLSRMTNADLKLRDTIIRDNNGSSAATYLYHPEGSDSVFKLSSVMDYERKED